MITILLNNEEFELNTYDHSTTFYDDMNTIGSSARLTLKCDTNVVDRLYSLGNINITSIIIKYNNDVIYSLTNQTAKIVKIDEILIETSIEIEVQLRFDGSII